MTAVFIVLTVQALMGAFDNLWHHEWQARLPQRASARHELLLHALREAIYGLLFLGFAWVQWQGAWVLLPATLLAVEIAITAADFLEEDRSRRLPPAERVLHTLLTASYGVLVGVIAPLFAAQAALPTAVGVAGHGAWSLLFTLAGTVVLAWSVRNALAVHRLRGVARAEAAASATPAPLARGPAVLVTGGTGFIGSALVQRLRQEGHRVIVATRDPLQARAAFGPGVWAVDRLDDIPPETAIAAVVHLAGAPILGLPWSARRRRQLVDSRVETARALRDLIARLHRRPQVLVGASAVGFYGVPEGGAVLREGHAPQPGRFQSDLCARIEQEALRAEALGVRVVCLRLGIVLGADGGAYPAQALAARWGLGAVLGHGRQPVPWIHRDDAVGLILHACRQPRLSGAVNAVAPVVPSQRAFAAALAASFGRGGRLRLPAWLLRAALGEMSELLLCGQRAVPVRAAASGYVFRHPTLEGAFRALARPAAAAATVGSAPAPEAPAGVAAQSLPQVNGGGRVSHSAAMACRDNPGTPFAS
ncbi:TIGR01777 family oxidoreductase [Acidovorax sp. GBBC 3334]|uniref:TIGR01777 family oxidoreductase n=1 Tax=Acidovorax sp. GBBC 3334 TaxID=2940496 RepID=UPI002303D0EC|nr:TIGR01777 family oxidoreductase [Acidovorax sp. GBBC 3334]MDA8455577.1 TIGR01777 family oxidoreductase [Acidovorax sp. GBBC 3334]